MRKKKFAFSGYLLAVLMLLGLLGTTVSAASSQKKTAWKCNGKTECKMEAEAGQTFYMNRMLDPYYDPVGLYTYVAGSWKSDNKKVASVSGKEGLVKTKKAGTAKISVKYGGKTYTCTLTVKKKGTFITGDYKKLMQADKALKSYNKKVTKSKLKKAVKALEKFMKARKKVIKKLDVDNGMLIKKPKRIVYQLQNPMAEWKIREAVEKVLKGSFKITSIKCNSASKMTFTLAKAVTKEQVDMINLMYEDYGYDAADLYFYNMVADEVDEYGDPMSEHSEDVNIWGICKFKKGSNKVTYIRSENCDTSFKKASLAGCNGDGLFRFKKGDELEISK